MKKWQFRRIKKNRRRVRLRETPVFYIAKTAKHRQGERFRSDQGKKRKDTRKVS